MWQVELNARVCVVSSVLVMLVCNGVYGGFHEAWEKASVGSYSSSDGVEAALIEADKGTWLAGSAVGSGGQAACGPNPHNVEIMEILGDKALRLTSNYSTGGCGDSVWVHLADFSKTSNLNLNRNFKISLPQDTFIYFEEIGELDMPGTQDDGASYDKITLTLQDLNGNELVYVLQRDPAAEPVVESAYRELFLDPSAGFYQRNLFEDFSTLSNFDPKAAKISRIVFEIDEHGWAIIGDIVIGRARDMPDPPEPGAHFQGLGLLPQSQWCTASALSADGRMVIGHDEHTGVPVYWNESTGMTPLPLGIAEGLAATRVHALSADGSMVVGTSPSTVFDAASEREQDAFYWTQTEGIRSLGYPSGIAGVWASAEGVSADGSYVAGVFRTADEDSHAFGWTKTEGMVDLGLLPGGQTHSGATALSYDGHVVVGWSDSAKTTANELSSAPPAAEAFRWTATEGMVGLGFLPGGGASEARAASMDGTVIVGAGTSDATPDDDHCYEAFRWSQLHSMHGLGFLPGYVESSAHAVSGDGRIVVGRSCTEDFACSVDEMTGDSRAFIWDAQHGLQDLKVVLGQGYHANVSGWRLMDAIGISADGSVIVGNGINPQGGIEPWMAVIPGHYKALDLAIVNPRLPDRVVAGGGTRITLPVSVTNLGDMPIDRDETIDLIIKARPLDGGPDVRLMVVSNQVIGVLNPGRSKRINVALYVPAGIATNDYIFVAQVGTAEATTPVDQPVTIEYGHVTLVGQITRNTLPASLIAGETARGTVSVQITNQGNIAVENNKTVDVTLLLQSQASDDTYELNKIENYNIGRLQPDRSKTLNISVTDTASVPEGTYNLLVTIESSDFPVPPVLGDAITIAQPFIELQMELVSATLPSPHIIGNDYKGSISIKVFNRGNVATDRSATATIEVAARSLDDDREFPLTPVDCTLSTISPERAKTVSVPISFPVSISEGTYAIVLSLDDSELILDAFEIVIVKPSIELTGTAGEASYTSDIANEDSVIEFSFDIINNGTSTTGKNQTIDISVHLKKTASDEDIPLGVVRDVSIGNLSSGGRKTLHLSIPVRPDLEDGEYQLLVLLDSSDVVTEDNETDNWIEWPDTLIIKPVEGFMDLTMFNSGKSMNYSVTVTGNYFWDNGTDVITTHYESSGGVDEYIFGTRQAYSWSARDDGVYLTYYNWRQGWDFYSTDFNALIAPAQLKLNEEVSSTSSASSTLNISNATAYLYGTADTSCTIKNPEKVTVNGVRYDAYKILLTIEINTQGDLDLTQYGYRNYTVTSTFKQTITYWAVPHVGVVKSSTRSSNKKSLSHGGGSETFSGTETRELAD